MGDHLDRAVAVVGVGAIMPDAPDAATFWENIKQGRYSISDVDPSRWDPQLYYDPDPKAPDKTYSKIGGWVRDWVWEPRAWNLAVMPRVADAMDDTQKWAVACTHQALNDYGYPGRTLDNDRVAVVFGNAMAGEQHYKTALRISFPELAGELGDAPSFRSQPNAPRGTCARQGLLGWDPHSVAGCRRLRSFVASRGEAELEPARAPQRGGHRCPCRDAILDVFSHYRVHCEDAGTLHGGWPGTHHATVLCQQRDLPHRHHARLAEGCFASKSLDLRGRCSAHFHACRQREHLRSGSRLCRHPPDHNDIGFHWRAVVSPTCIVSRHWEQFPKSCRPQVFSLSFVRARLRR